MAKITSFRKRRQRIGTFLPPSIFLVVLFAVVGILLWYNWDMQQRRTALMERIEQLQREIDEASQKKAELETSFTESQSAEYQEKVLREQGLYKKPGEEVITILPPREQEGGAQSQEKKRVWWDPRTWFSW